jgi:hypothetical protein
MTLEWSRCFGGGLALYVENADAWFMVLVRKRQLAVYASRKHGPRRVVCVALLASKYVASSALKRDAVAFLACWGVL